MKRALALILAAMMTAGMCAATLVQVGAEDEVVDTDIVETAEETTEAEASEETAEETAAETTEEAPPAKRDPAQLKDFVTTDSFLQGVGEGKQTLATVTEDGYIHVSANNDANEWFSEEEGYYVDAYIELGIGWYLRQNKDAYTANKLTLNDSNKLIAIKVKQQDNYLEEAPLELWFSVPNDPKSNNLAANLAEGVIFSLTTIHGEDGFDYLVFDVSTSEDEDLWRGALAKFMLKWASCNTVVDPSLAEEDDEDEVEEETTTAEDDENKITHPAQMDIYEICFFGSQEDIEAYVGTEFEWETEPEVEVETKEPAKTESATEAATTAAATTSKGGCGSVISSVSVLAAAVLAAGVVVCKKKD